MCGGVSVRVGWRARVSQHTLANKPVSDGPCSRACVWRVSAHMSRPVAAVRASTEEEQKQADGRCVCCALFHRLLLLMLMLLYKSNTSNTANHSPPHPTGVGAHLSTKAKPHLLHTQPIPNARIQIKSAELLYTVHTHTSQTHPSIHNQLSPSLPYASSATVGSKSGIMSKAKVGFDRILMID